MITRRAVPDDAPQLILYVPRLADEPDSTIPLAPGEFSFTEEQERKLLADYEKSDNSIYVVAERDGVIIGVASCDGGARLSTKHCAGISISVAREERNQGIGAALMNHLIEWAQSTNISRLDLEVYAHNAPAIHLYRKFGFVDEGRRVKAYLANGRFVDGLLMARQI